MNLKLYMGQVSCEDEKHQDVLKTLRQIDMVTYSVHRSLCSHTSIEFAIKAEDLRSIWELYTIVHALLTIGDVKEATFWITDVQL